MLVYLLLIMAAVFHSGVNWGMNCCPIVRAVLLGVLWVGRKATSWVRLPA